MRPDSFRAHPDNALAFDGLFRKADFVSFHFLIQGGMVDTEEFRGVLLIAVESLQNLDQYGPLQGIYEIF